MRRRLSISPDRGFLRRTAKNILSRTDDFRSPALS